MPWAESHSPCGGCYEIAGALPKEIRHIGKLSERLPRKGLWDSAQVFHPGKYPNKWLALKGREINRIRRASSPTLWLFRTLHLPPFQGALPLDGNSPGLKPRAEPSRPLRGEEASQILLIFAPFDPEVSPRDICRRNGLDAALETPGIPVERSVGV